MPVLGIGGLFFRSADPDALSAWYKEHLGVGANHGPGGTDWAWGIEAGPVVFQPFKATSDYFAADRQYMLNLRVSDIAGLIASLEAAGIDVEQREEWKGDYGHFARVRDPEGNEIELWEPPAA
jgi:catechol 2,3-dioxygenase-like lactoylglutathione lyase family enzyme